VTAALDIWRPSGLKGSESFRRERKKEKIFFIFFSVFGGVWSLNCRVIIKENTKQCMNVFFFFFIRIVFLPHCLTGMTDSSNFNHHWEESATQSKQDTFM
jgi:hypothetical protein